MTQVIVGGPLEELELADEHGLQPYTLGHLRLREPLSPSPTPCLWKIGKRGTGRLESLEFVFSGLRTCPFGLPQKLCQTF